MMKRALLGVAALVLAGSMAAKADLSWIYTSNMTTWDASVQSGWAVVMYQDVNKDSVLGNINTLGAGGVVSGATANTSDDVLLSTFKTTLVSGKSGTNFGTSFASWGSLYGSAVYSVLYNAADYATATRAVVIDASRYTLASSDPGVYSLSSVNNSWVGAVPEPTTLAFLGLGFGAFLLRKRMRK